MTELFDRRRHEPPTARPWSAGRARDAIAAIAAEAESAFDPDGLWPSHPLDEEEDDPAWLWLGLHMGAAGVIWALDELRRTGVAELRGSYAETAAGLHTRYLASTGPDERRPSLWMGEAGLLLTAQRLAATAARADELHARVDQNVDSPENELMWGNPGTMLAAQAMHERTGEERWRELWLRGAERLWAEWRLDEELGCHLWMQRLSGSLRPFLGPAHGFAANVAVLARGASWLPEERVASLDARTAETLERLAVRADGLANWPPLAGGALAVGDERRIRVQWCHGAPGIVASLARVAVHDEAFGDLLGAGGELTWSAGPIAGSPGLCHGTAGNGLALLALFGRTGDERWLERARRFGMHALEQVERARAEHGRGRFSLWTGDLGVALYLRDCLEGTAAAPTIDVL